MFISHVEIVNFRALEYVSVPLNQFSVLIGENDVGKTSFLFALDKFFADKKLSEPTDWFKEDTSKDIRIVLTFQNIPKADELSGFVRKNGDIIISKVFYLGIRSTTNVILDDDSEVEISSAVLKQWFSQDSFHFIPVRRDLAVQFSMAKTALLGKTPRANMKKTIDEGVGSESLKILEKTALLASLWVHIQLTTMKQYSDPVVIKVSKAARRSFDLLDFAVQPFGNSVGNPVLEIS